MKRKNNICYYIVGFLVLLTSICYFGVKYLKKYYVVSFEMLIITFFSNTKGTGTEVISHAIIHIIPFVLLTMLAYVIFAIVFNHNFINVDVLVSIKKKNIKIGLLKIIYIIIAVFSLLIIYRSSINLGLNDYIQRKKQVSTIYEDYYISPNDINIISPDNKKNIIYIYLESMESTYMSINEDAKEYNIIPNLQKLAENNINFSFSESVGGLHNVTGTEWTVAALLSSESATPYGFPIGRNDMNDETEFAPNIIMLGDILSKDGYTQEFLCGSDARFGSRDALFKTHGDYKIYDYYSALNDGYVDDYVYWGLEDKVLYKIAKDELLKLSKSGQPFNFTMLTVDTHPSSGWFCELCENNYDNQYYNVVNCADKQVCDFVEWIKKQDFYDNTLIVISGDHVTMENTGNVNNNVNRYVYNCFINSSINNEESTKNRKCNILDMFPTILTAMGYEIENDKLGFGTNLFSNKETLEEELGYEYINDELKKYSNYFANNFY